MRINRSTALADGVQIAVTDTTLFSPGQTVGKTVVETAKFVNTGAGVATISVWVIPQGQSKADNYKVISNKQVGVDDTFISGELAGAALLGGSTASIIAVSDIVGVSCWMTGTKYSTNGG